MPRDAPCQRAEALAPDIVSHPAQSAARVERRHKTFFVAMVRISSGEMRVHILDMSRAGARLHGAFAVVVGDIVHLALGNDHVAARVRWTKGRMFGVEFCRSLDQALVTRILNL
ncbi:MAG: hypothetical protein C0429_08575 [Sphingopyxis sp.]|nr:hypothetical protein [Sphingopyxis sp.]